MIDEKRIEEIRRRCEAVSPGAWSVKLHSENYGQGHGCTTYYVDRQGDLLKIGVAETNDNCKKYHAEADFYAHSRDDLSYLLDIVKNLQSQLTQADRRADAVVEDINSLRGNPAPCLICEFDDLIGCCHKNHCNENNEYFKWRGGRKESERVRR